jgi:hypothetical protein
MEQSEFKVKPVGPHVPEVQVVARLPVLVGRIGVIATPFVREYGLAGYVITGGVITAIEIFTVEVPPVFVAETV